MKRKIFLWGAGLIIGCIALIWITFPAPPASWAMLKNDMPRSKVYKLAITSDMQEQKKISSSEPVEVWRKSHMFGYWEIRLYYYNNLRLSGAHVRYVSYLLPFIKRMRNY